MSDQQHPEDADESDVTPKRRSANGAVDYSTRAYTAPGEYRAPDFLSQWATKDRGAAGADPTQAAEAAPQARAPGRGGERRELLERIATLSSSLLHAQQQELARTLEAAERAHRRLRGSPPAAVDAPAPAPAEAPEDHVRKQGRGLGWLAFLATTAAVACAILGFSPPVWFLLVIALVSGVLLATRKGASRALAVVLLVISIVTAGFQIGSGGRSDGFLSGGIDLSFGAVAGSLSLAAAPAFSGSGNARLNVELPDGTGQIGLLRVDFAGSEFEITDMDDSGEELGRSGFSEYRDDDGIAVINSWLDDDFTGVAIESDGDWTVTLLPLEVLPTFEGEATGVGSALLVYTGPGGTATIDVEPYEYVSIDTYASGDHWASSINGFSSASRDLGPGPLVFELDQTGDRPWSVTVSSP